jgi:hypothetical protein
MRLNPTVLALLGGVVILIGVIWFFSTNRNSDQDKLADNQIAQTQGPTSDPEKQCSANATYDLIKRELFRWAAEVRGSDQATYDNLAGFAVLRMENPVLESQDPGNGALNCSGSASLDLPPGVTVTGGKRTLIADVDYTIERSGAVTVRNADPIIASLATLARVATPPEGAETNTLAPEATEGNIAASESANVRSGPPSAYPGRPSFDCARAESRGEIAVCSDSGLAALDVNMTTQYRRALTSGSAEQLQLLQKTRDRFLAYRDRCPNRQCMADAYVGRMREIRDIMEGRLTAR